jgi:hypothetical protein
MSSVVNTYLKVKQKHIPISEYTETFPDKDYIEGAIECRIDNRDIFTMEHWDLVRAYVSQLAHNSIAAEHII